MRHILNYCHDNILPVMYQICGFDIKHISIILSVFKDVSILLNVFFSRFMNELAVIEMYSI